MTPDAKPAGKPAMKLGVIIAAAGASRRYLEGGPGQEFARSKLDEDLGGRPVLHRTVELFVSHDQVSVVVVAGPAEEGEFESFKQRHGDKLALLGVKICRGGKDHRYESVRNALAELPEDCTHIAVHDAARPCTPLELLDRVFDSVQKHPAVIPAVEVADTLKRVLETEEAKDEDPLDRILGTGGGSVKVRRVEETIDRRSVMAVQTPQVFEASLLRRAYAQSDLTSTDDSQLVERLGEPVVVIAGDNRNIKITRGPDLGLARAILGVRGPEGRAVHKRF
jgi:2-C-methyl-D-erythritol 4-phosphate cytidylyltransferase